MTWLYSSQKRYAPEISPPSHLLTASMHYACLRLLVFARVSMESLECRICVCTYTFPCPQLLVFALVSMGILECRICMRRYVLVCVCVCVWGVHGCVCMFDRVSMEILEYKIRLYGHQWFSLRALLQHTATHSNALQCAVIHRDIFCRRATMMSWIS